MLVKRWLKKILAWETLFGGTIEDLVDGEFFNDWHRLQDVVCDQPLSALVWSGPGVGGVDRTDVGPRKQRLALLSCSYRLFVCARTKTKTNLKMNVFVCSG